MLNRSTSVVLVLTAEYKRSAYTKLNLKYKTENYDKKII